jgi:16S rRNA (cytidine1402-2'-O)-methyltransferase
MLAIFGNRSICAARELTKAHEEIWRGSIAEALDHFGAEILGEFVLVVAGAPQEQRWDEARVRAALQAALAAGESATFAAKEIAALSGWNKREVYALIEREA